MLIFESSGMVISIDNQVFSLLSCNTLSVSGPGNVVIIATSYGLDGPGIESRRGARFSAPVQTGPGAHSASCTMGTGSFLRVKNGRGVTLTPHPLPVPWSRKSRAITLLPLWAVRPVQSLSACTRVHFTLPFTISGYKDIIIIIIIIIITWKYLYSFTPVWYCFVSYLCIYVIIHSYCSFNWLGAVRTTPQQSELN